jgi:hypothetical protein
MISFDRLVSVVSKLNSDFVLERDFERAKRVFRESVVKLRPRVVTDTFAVVKTYKRDRYGRVTYMVVKLTLTRLEDRPLVVLDYL